MVGLHVLRQHQHAHLGVFGADAPGGVQALAGVGRGHADVHHDRVRWVDADQREQPLGVASLGGHLDAAAIEHPHQAASSPSTWVRPVKYQPPLASRSPPALWGSSGRPAPPTPTCRQRALGQRSAARTIPAAEEGPHRHHPGRLGLGQPVLGNHDPDHRSGVLVVDGRAAEALRPDARLLRPAAPPTGWPDHSTPPAPRWHSDRCCSGAGSRRCQSDGPPAAAVGATTPAAPLSAPRRSAAGRPRPRPHPTNRNPPALDHPRAQRTRLGLHEVHLDLASRRQLLLLAATA
jgi:hypothetical protein